MNIAKKLILKSISEANSVKKTDYKCDYCFINYLGDYLFKDSLKPCSLTMKALNNQYKTKYEVTAGCFSKDPSEILKAMNCMRTIHI